MKILGIDPGFGRMGYGVIEGGKSDWVAVQYGCVETPAKTDFSSRLLSLHDELNKILKKFQPDRAAVEELFFAANAKTAMQVGAARGVILLTLLQAKLPVDEYTPLEVKQAVTGYGRAEKQQVQKMLQLLLKLPNIRLQDDAADALAVALSAGLFLKHKAQAQESTTRKLDKIVIL